MKYSITKLSIVVLTLVMVGCGSTSTDKKAELDKLIKEQAALNDKINTLRKELAGKDASTKTRKVEVADLTQKPFVHYIDVQAKVDGDQNVNVAPQMPGTIKSILVREGQAVTKGQILATLDDAVVLQGINELQTQLDFATTVFKKQDNLWEAKNRK
ncbi:MAG: biotin/lipoyl-binding protein [Bacteroidetes bacterium]|nr:biotin/lipoyl-binding protein [Bacteroidota bacterium]